MAPECHLHATGMTPATQIRSQPEKIKKRIRFSCDQRPVKPPHRFSFRSTSELVEIVQRFGIHWQVAQISQGPLQGTISLQRRSDFAVLQLSTNQIITVLGARPHSTTCIALERTDHLSDHSIRGEAVSPFSLHGFTPSITESFFQISAGGEMTIVMMGLKRFLKLIALDPASRLRATIDNSNTLTVPPWQFQRLVGLLDPNQEPPPADLLDALLVECFSRDAHFQSQGVTLSTRAALMRDLLAWGFDNPDTPISLDQLTRTLFASRSSIVQSCREIFGVGPTTLLKQIRLHEVHRALNHPQEMPLLSERPGVGAIAGLHGFTSGNHFARDYRAMFGEAPSATLQRSLAA